jgi:Holliday junction resolvasome RuvABC DNA-binding subunit
MYSYIIGKIISINNHSITLESNYCAYIIKVRNPKHFEINKVKKIYLFKTASIIDNQIYEIMYGFESYDEK